MKGMKKKSAASVLKAAPADDKRWRERYEAEEDLRVLTRAAAVRKDPDRMARCKAMAKEKLEETQRRKDDAISEANMMEKMADGKMKM
jgi:hypothetical protein